MNHVLLAESYRNNLLEGEHYGSVVVSDSEGKIIASIGSEDYSTFIRSSLKMVQAIPVIESGAAHKFNFNNSEISICCASHCGANFHISTVAGMLDKMGLAEHHLNCGSHKPENESELKKLYLLNQEINQLYNNCSGKHSGMLAVCLAKGWALENYVNVEHKLQQDIFKLVAHYTNRPTSSIKYGIDGCSLPTVFLSLQEMATMLARFTKESNTIGSPQNIIFDAVYQQPQMINDTNGFDSLLVKNSNGKLIAKRGAMAVFVMGIHSEQYGELGIAIKLISGDSTAMPPVVMRVLEQLKLLTDSEMSTLDKFKIIEQSNWNKIPIGRIASNFTFNNQ